MSATHIDVSASEALLAATAPAWRLPSRRKVGVACLIATESALFSIFVVAYLFYIGKSLDGPQPREVLDVPWLASAFLFSSSATIVIAERALRRAANGPFALWWLATILLGAAFLFETAREWRRLIEVEGLTLSTNLFGTSFYSLVGLHASHVAIGLVLLSIVFVARMRGTRLAEHEERVQMIGWYWHFVDAIWVVVFTVVYFIGR